MGEGTKLRNKSENSILLKLQPPCKIQQTASGECLKAPLLHEEFAFLPFSSRLQHVIELWGRFILLSCFYGLRCCFHCWLLEPDWRLEKCLLVNDWGKLDGRGRLILMAEISTHCPQIFSWIFSIKNMWVDRRRKQQHIIQRIVPFFSLQL